MCDGRKTVNDFIPIVKNVDILNKSINNMILHKTNYSNNTFKHWICIDFLEIVDLY